jgi:RNA polymerase sigma factor (sigma-70 family)
MQELNDIALLREYVAHDSEEAFATLVTRHVNKVYSVALRHTRNPHQAEEITQAVFVILAKKARALPKAVILSGWVFRTAQLTAVTFLRSEIRRAHREQEAHMQTLLNETEPDVWPQIALRLDAAMAGLNEMDHNAVVLRFFDGKSMKEIGTALGVSEDTAKKRVHRAVEKLRVFFMKGGVVLPAAILMASISANSVQAAPALLAKSATAVAATKGATASGSTLALVNGTLKLMAWLKAQAAIVIGATVAFAAGITMRELDLPETLCLCWGLMLCLVLPMMMSANPPKEMAARVSCMKIIWSGQALLAITGLVVLFSAAGALYATAIGTAGYIGCAFMLQKKLSAVKSTTNAPG